MARLECLLNFEESAPAAWRQAARDDLAEDAQFFVAVAGDPETLYLWLADEYVGDFYLTKAMGSKDWAEGVVLATSLAALFHAPRPDVPPHLRLVKGSPSL